MIAILFSIALSSLILFQSININFNDFFQLDELLEHAQFHNEKYGDTFFVFISKHYGDLKNEHKSNNQEDKTDHEQLPFQQQSNIAFVSDFILVKKDYNKQKVEYSCYSETFFYYQSSKSTFCNKGVFQPPKQA